MCLYVYIFHTHKYICMYVCVFIYLAQNPLSRQAAVSAPISQITARRASMGRERKRKNFTLRNIFEILSNQTEIRLYLPFFD